MAFNHLIGISLSYLGVKSNLLYNRSTFTLSFNIWLSNIWRLIIFVIETSYFEVLPKVIRGAKVVHLRSEPQYAKVWNSLTSLGEASSLPKAETALFALSSSNWVLRLYFLRWSFGYDFFFGRSYFQELAVREGWKIGLPLSATCHWYLWPNLDPLISVNLMHHEGFWRDWISNSVLTVAIMMTEADFQNFHFGEKLGLPSKIR